MITVTTCPHGVDLRFAKCLMCDDPAFHAAARTRLDSVNTATTIPQSWSGHAPDLVRDNKLMHERLAEQDREIARLTELLRIAESKAIPVETAAPKNCARRLAEEVLAAFSIGEYGIRDAIGNTNFTIVKGYAERLLGEVQRIDDALSGPGNATSSKSRKDAGPDQPGNAGSGPAVATSSSETTCCEVPDGWALVPREADDVIGAYIPYGNGPQGRDFYRRLVAVAELSGGASIRVRHWSCNIEARGHGRCAEWCRIPDQCPGSAEVMHRPSPVKASGESSGKIMKEPQ